MRKPALAVAICLVVSLICLTAEAGVPGGAWSEGRKDVARALGEGRPLVVHVTVPLCSNDQIRCGNDTGNPKNPRTNLYWGAAFGARRFFERKGSDWERVELVSGKGPTLERVIYRRRVSGAPFGRARDVEQLVVLEAIDGAQIDTAVHQFFGHATNAPRVSFKDGVRTRSERVLVAGYAGHNRLMDGLTLPKEGGEAPIPSFVLACQSDAYFSEALAGKGSRPLVMTRTFMAPEGYVVEAVARGLGENLSPADLYRRASAAYAKWQRLSPKAAGHVFAPKD